MKKLTLLIAIFSIAEMGFCSMRSVSYRDEVLYALAYFEGLDPTGDNFLLSNQANAYASFINGWVRRLWDAEDWPEWTFIRPFAVGGIIGVGTVPIHIVPYDALPSDFNSATELATRIGSVLKVYLADPSTTTFPVDTAFGLTPTGIFCGLEHGPTVWIKYRIQCPRFTATPWLPTRTYNSGEVTYSPTTGECYISKASGNTGHDPAIAITNGGPDNPILNQFTPEVTQPFQAGSPGLAAQDKQLVLYMLGAQPGPDPPTTPPLNTDWQLEVEDASGTPIGTATHSASGAETLATITTTLGTALGTSLGGGFAVAVDTSALTITVSGGSDFTMLRCIWTPPSGTPTNFMIVKQTRAYFAGLAGAFATNQILSLTLSDTDAAPNAVYTMTVLDSSGGIHVAQYTSLVADGVGNILAGLIADIQNQSLDDTFFAALFMSLDATGHTMTISAPDRYSITVGVEAPAPATYWQPDPFPFALVDQVLRGAKADSLREKGQFDKADGEEQKVPTEEAVKVKTVAAPQYDRLTDQQGPKSRYSVK